MSCDFFENIEFDNVPEKNGAISFFWVGSGNTETLEFFCF